jgi:folate-binding protein YgfZ
MSEPASTYAVARSSSSCLDRSDRVRLRVGGPDRAKFLHNLTTNDVKRLALGKGVESFVTSPQGKTIGFVTLLARDDHVLLATDPGGAALIGPHFDKYGVFDDVTIDDVSPSTYEFHLAGPQAEDTLRTLGAELPEAGDLRHRETTIGGRPVLVVREAPLGLPGFTLIGGSDDAASVRAALGVSDLDAANAEALRIEAGTPAFGRDVTAENLPQEVGRDARAINFVKGCYLGQETVARIDAIGHVNRHLRGLRLADATTVASLPGARIEADGKPVGTVTSAAYSPGANAVVALAYLRTAHAAPGTAVEVVTDAGRVPAVVHALPSVAESLR